MVWWVANDQERDEILATSKIALWPAPNTARVNRFMRMKNMLPNCHPAAGRIFVEMLPTQVPPQVLRAIVTIDNFAENDCWGETEADADGRKIKVSIRSDDDFVDNQGTHWSGIVYAFEYSRTGFDWWRRSFIDADGGHTSQSARFPSFVHHDSFNRFGGFLDEFGGPNPDWGFTVFQQVAASSVSQCWTPPGAALGPLGGFAEFNGVDAYISLDHNTINHNGPHFLEAELRMNARGIQTIMGRQTSASVWGFDGFDGRWSNQTFGALPLPPLNVWFKYRQEFEWSSGLQLRYEIFIDDVLEHAQTSGRINTFWQNLGVRRRQTAPVWGDFDLKNLKYHTGSFASPIVRLDMPLQINALDSGPDANHGTTFNMALPSV